MKDFKMGQLSWMIWVGPQRNHRSPSKREEEGDWTHTEERAMWRQRQNLEWRLMSQGMPSATRSWRKQEINFPLEYLAKPWACQDLDFGPVKLTSDFWTPEPWENTRLLLGASKFVVICYNSQTKLIQTGSLKSSIVSASFHILPVSIQTFKKCSN